MAEGVLDVTDESFETEVLKSEQPTLVDFWAPWCAPCRAMTPFVEKLAGEMGGKVKVVKLNTEDHSQVPIKYGITSIPTFLVFHGGKVVEQVVGGRSYDDLKELVSKHVS